MLGSIFKYFNLNKNLKNKITTIIIFSLKHFGQNSKKKVIMSFALFLYYTFECLFLIKIGYDINQWFQAKDNLYTINYKKK